jgi:hypothetical protein
MVVTYLTLLLLFVLPMGLEWYLQGIQSVTTQQLAALTVTSPFSAALSVPMHTNRNENWVNQSPTVADSVIVPLLGTKGLPVWAIFLCIYPPLSLALFFFTYLAFRWRWWRSGGLG